MSASPTLTVGRICQTQLLSCGPDLSLAEAAQRLYTGRCSSIVIFDDGKAIGIWTERDALAVDLSDPATLERPISEVMSTPVRSIPSTMTIGEATLSFKEAGIRHFLVSDAEKPDRILGIVSQSDVVLNHGIEYYLQMRDVGSVMTLSHTGVPAHLPLSTVSRQMHEFRLDAVAVEYEDGTLGILTERDVVRAISTHEQDAPVGRFASRPLVTVPVSASLYTARSVLATHNMRHLGIVRGDGTLAGLLSFSDILTSIEHNYVQDLQHALNQRDEQLATSRDKLRLAGKMFETTLEAIVVTDAKGAVTSVNPAFRRLTGYADDEMAARPTTMLASGRGGPAFDDGFWSMLRHDGFWQGEIWSRKKSGELFLKMVTVTGIKERGADYTNFAIVFADTVSSGRDAERLHYLANHDPLTGLPNRHHFTERLSRAIPRNRAKLAVLHLDLDRFRIINEALGYAAGDDVLGAVARRLNEVIGETGTVCRLVGDEFAVLLEGLAGEEEAARIARTLLDTLAAPVEIAGSETFVTASLGISIHPGDGDDHHSLMANADTAKCQAKEGGGRNSFGFFTHEMDQQTRHRLTLETGLRRAVERGEITVHYQPKVDLRTMRVAGMEALARWNHPELGQISPAQFIPLAEDSGAITAIGAWVLETACAQAEAWRHTIGPLQLAVNLSGCQLRSPEFPETVRAILERTGLPPHMLELEITETVAMADVHTSLAVLKKLAAMGPVLSIDDFGTGYSSFAYLRLFPIGGLKIDRSFIIALGEDDRAAAIPAAIVSMAHILGLSVVAEGVETPEQLVALQKAGCEEGQGYYFSPPLPAAQFAKYCRTAEFVVGPIGARYDQALVAE